MPVEVWEEAVFL